MPLQLTVSVPLCCFTGGIDDGVVAGPISAVLRVLSIINDLGPPLGLHINLSKCVNDLSRFPDEMKKPNVPHFDILGAPIGDYLFCAKYIAQKRTDASKLLQQLAQVGFSDPHVAMLLLRQCGGFCRLIHLARTIPPSLAGDALSLFDDEMRQCFAECTAVDTPDFTWQQAQLSLSQGGLGLHRVSYHSPAAYLASAVSSGLSHEVCRYLHHSIDHYKNLVDPPDSLTDSFDNSCSSLTQKFLSNKIEDCQFRKLFDKSTPFDRTHLLSISSPHASAWLSVTPSPSMGLHLEPSEFQVAIKWWLGIPVAQGQSCSQCNAALDTYGHHALCCKLGGAFSRHNRLRDVFNDFCHCTCLAPKLEMGGWSREHTRPADVLVPNWVLG